MRKVPQLYSPKASYIATQLYLGYAQVIFASRVFGANIISLKLQVSISLCVITQNITVRQSLTISLIIFIRQMKYFAGQNVMVTTPHHLRGAYSGTTRRSFPTEGGCLWGRKCYKNYNKLLQFLCFYVIMC